jgi:putative oxidoreductase
MKTPCEVTPPWYQDKALQVVFGQFSVKGENRMDRGLLFFLFRLALSGAMIFSAVTGGISKRAATIQFAAYRGVMRPEILVPVALLILFLGAVLLLFGFRPVLGIGLILFFLVCVTPLMHAFWRMQGQEAEVESHFFFGNIMLFGAVGALLMVPRPWPWSVENK